MCLDVRLAGTLGIRAVVAGCVASVLELALVVFGELVPTVGAALDVADLGHDYPSFFSARQWYGEFVGVTGFEPATYPLDRATRLRHTPRAGFQT